MNRLSIQSISRLIALTAFPALACALTAPGAVDSTTPRPGAAVYSQHCAACHGEQGDGNGPAAVWLFPKPRNFSAGLFKIQSTPAGSLPTDEDLFQTVTRGMPGTSMPSFTYLPESQRREAVQQVKYLTAYTNDSGQLVNRFEEARQKGELKEPFPVPPEPPVSVQTLTRGQEVFTKLQCFTCHGETGAGDGPSAPTLKDNWGYPLPPRDFNTGAFRGGYAGSDLYRRIATGLAGTPMPPFTDQQVSPEDRWALVQYIQSLRRKEIEIGDILAPADSTLQVARLQKLPASPVDPAWEQLEPMRIPLNPLWPETNPLPAVAIRAVHDGQKLMLHATWPDPIINGSAVRMQDFEDAMAVQFSLTGNVPFLGMGDAQNPVNLWQWKAGWQLEVDRERPEVNLVYVSMHVDTYFQEQRQFRTATDASNLRALPHTSPVEDANASGFGTLKTQPIDSQNVQGSGVWRDAHWSVVLVRDLKSRDKNDVTFQAGKPVPVAFAIWDGENRDRNGRKVISNWYQLTLER